MKKVLLLFCLLLAGAATAAGQTLHYNAVSVVDTQTGIRSESSGGIYITFTGEGCYESDASGNRTQPNEPFYKFRYREGDVLVFQQWNPVGGGGEYWGCMSFAFSTDYKRANFRRDFYPYVTVYEQGPPENNRIREKLY